MSPKKLDFLFIYLFLICIKIVLKQINSLVKNKLNPIAIQHVGHVVTNWWLWSHYYLFIYYQPYFWWISIKSSTKVTWTHHDFLFLIDRIRKAALANNFLVEVGIGHVCQHSWVEDRERVVKEKRSLCFDENGSISCTPTFFFLLLYLILYYNLVVD